MSHAQRVPYGDLPDDIPSMSIPNSESPWGDNPTVDGGFNSPPPMPDVELPKSKAETELILKGLTSTYATAGKLLFLFSPPDGAQVLSNTEEMVESWRSLLDNDTKFRKKMLKLVQASGWGAVMSAHLPVALAIAGNHRDGFSHLIKRPTSPPDET